MKEQLNQLRRDIWHRANNLVAAAIIKILWIESKQGEKLVKEAITPLPVKSSEEYEVHNDGELSLYLPLV